MSLPFPLYMAFKYLKPKRSMVSIITVLTTLGIVLGVAVLIVVLSVMTGFDDVHREHMIKLDSHLQIAMPGDSAFSPDPVIDAVKTVPEVRVVSPTVDGFVLMIEDGEAVTAVLRGVDPLQESEISDVGAMVVAGSFDLEEDTVVVGNRLAANLGVWVGDTLTVYSPQCFVSEDELRLPIEVVVSGIFSVDMYDVDSQLMVSSLETAREVFGLEDGVLSLRVITRNPYQAEHIQEKIDAALLAGSERDAGLWWLRRLDTRTWMQINARELGVLAVEKNMMFLLLCMISLVATMSVTNTLITLSVQKTHEIGLLQALGFSSHRVVGIFFLLGTMQGVLGCIFGALLGWWISANVDVVLGFLRHFNPELMSAQFYQFAEMPSRTTWSDVLLVCAIVMVFSALAGVLPSMRAASMQPVDALRYE